MKQCRIYDTRTDTYAFADGSGLITREQIEMRKSLKILATLEGNPPRKAVLIFKLLTFFSK